MGRQEIEKMAAKTKRAKTFVFTLNYFTEEIPGKLGTPVLI